MVREVTYALGDLVGKGEPAQGSSTTIHDLARPSAYGDVFIMVEPTRNNENQLRETAIALLKTSSGLMYTVVHQIL